MANDKLNVGKHVTFRHANKYNNMHSSAVSKAAQKGGDIATSLQRRNEAHAKTNVKVNNPYADKNRRAQTMYNYVKTDADHDKKTAKANLGYMAKDGRSTGWSPEAMKAKMATSYLNARVRSAAAGKPYKSRKIKK